MKKIATILIISFSITSYTQNVGEKYRLDINKINMPLSNRGVIAQVNIPPVGSGGLFDGITFLFSSGFLLTGYTNDTLWANGVASAGLIEDYLPGTINVPHSDPRAAIYKLSSDDIDFGESWQDWKDAVDLGADFYEGDEDGIYDPVDKNSNGIWDPNEDKPDLLGDVTLWCVYNDSRPANQRRYETVEPMGIEIRQTIFAFAETGGAVANTLFLRYKIVNKGIVTNVMDSVHFGMYADPDIGDFLDDSGGCDTLLNANIAYNSGDDMIYGSNTPAFFMNFLAGPVTYIPGVTFIDNNGNGVYENGIDTPLDTAYIRRGELGVRVFIGAKNLEMTSSINYSDGGIHFGDPGNNPIEARNQMLGFMRDGAIHDPCTSPFGEVRGGINCEEVNPIYWFSGDPVTDIGWISIFETDIRSINTVGPFQLKKNKPVEIFSAYVIGRGIDELKSITVGRELTDEIIELFENNLGYPIVLNTDDGTKQAYNFILEQNYPNPFNPSTKIKYSIPEMGFVTIKVFDVLGREVITLVNEEKPVGSCEVDFDASYLASGVYFYKLKAGGFVKTRKMILLK
jgi:hypothetical protein